VMLVCAVAVSGVTLGAQAAKPAPKPAAAPASAKPEPAPAKAAPAEQALPLNIKIEVNITDQVGSGPAARKVVSMIVGDRQSTSIRSSASVPVKVPAIVGNQMAQSYTYRNVTINVDARPAILYKEPSKILVTFGLEYFPKPAGGAEEMEPGMASINERLGLIFESGKPFIVSQAADPTSDRKITVEVTATILK
jgi:phosphohistidine swiveling domain-containing protein